MITASPIPNPDSAAPHTVSDDRLAQIMDGEVTAFQYEIPVIAGELLARRSTDRQRESSRYRGPDVPQDATEV